MAYGARIDRTAVAGVPADAPRTCEAKDEADALTIAARAVDAGELGRPRRHREGSRRTPAPTDHGRAGSDRA